MKKNWIKFVTFCLILTAGLVCLDLFVFVEKDYATSYSCFYKEQENTLDYVVVGNSTVQEGIDPCLAWHESGVTGYNISNKPTHLEVIVIAIDEIARTQKPKVVYVDINGITFQKKADQEKFVNDYVTDMPECESREMLVKKYPYLQNVEKTQDKKEVFSYHNEFRQPKYWKTLSQDSFNYSKGFDPTFSVWKQKVHKIDKNKTLELPEDGKEYLVKILETCKKYPEINFVFGRMPRFSNEAVADEIFKLRSAVPIINSYGYTYVDWEDYNAEIGLDPKKDFRDINHMNINGAQKFTRYFISYLDQNFDITNTTHSKETVDNFNNAYKNYLK